ncbi:MAG TPA: nodulation protein NfeD [Firmicutes bacterium]|nr:nodulation protein NfeD [Bacillota bacterium]
MGKIMPALLFAAILLVSPFAAGVAHGAGDIVYVVKIDETVERGLVRYVERAFREAAANDADAIILELNTPGGLVDAAGRIQEVIYDAEIPVYAYVRYDALSAGAFLALSCQALYMAPGSSIGAAEIQNLTGEPVDEKTVSAWESKMRTAAERQGKDAQVAAAMVRKAVEIEGLVGPDELLTLTAEEAVRIGFADGIYARRTDLYEALGLAGAAETVVELSPAERFARFVTGVYIAPLLLAVGLVALVVEVLTAGFGVAGLISIIAFALFFGGHIVAGLAGSEVLFLFVAGIILLLIEAFIPGFGVFGIGGLVAIVASVVLSAASTGEGIRILLSSVVIAALLLAILYRYLKVSGAWSHIVLQYAETKERGYVGTRDYAYLVGKEGTALTALRPSGTCEIDGERIDVVSEGEFITSGTRIKVVKAEGTRVVVRPA